MSIGLTVGSFILILIMLEPGKGFDVKRIKQEQHSSMKMAESNKIATTPTSPVKRNYDFYTLLQESKVIVPPYSVPEKTIHSPQVPTIPPPRVTKFFLQAGSFRKQIDADRVRVQIILLGQTVTVSSGTVNNATWYRVIVGPFSNIRQIDVAQKQLACEGFNNLLLQEL